MSAQLECDGCGAYQDGYDDACEVTDEMLANTLETCESFRKLNARYFEEIKRLRGLLGLDPFPLFDVGVQEGQP